jgi:hypothetical protein
MRLIIATLQSLSKRTLPSLLNAGSITRADIEVDCKRYSKVAMSHNQVMKRSASHSNSKRMGRSNMEIYKLPDNVKYVSKHVSGIAVLKGLNFRLFLIVSLRCEAFL